MSRNVDVAIISVEKLVHDVLTVVANVDFGFGARKVYFTSHTPEPIDGFWHLIACREQQLIVQYGTKKIRKPSTFSLCMWDNAWTASFRPLHQRRLPHTQLRVPVEWVWSLPAENANKENKCSNQ